MDNDGNVQKDPAPAVAAAGPLDWRALLKGTFFALAIGLPLAFYLRTYDSAMAKVTLLQFGALAAAAVWLIGGIAEGRFEFPARAVPLALPAVLLLVWNAARFSFSGYRLASLHGFILQEIFLLTFILVLSVFGRSDMRRTVLMVLGAWTVAVIYGLLQFFGLDPFVWKGAFGSRVFSTLANPTLLSAYLIVCTPLAMALACDEQEPLWLRVPTGVIAAAAAFLLQRTGDVIGRAAFLAAAGVFAVMSWKLLSGRRRAAALLAAAACAAAAALPMAGPAPAPANDRHFAFLSETWKGTAALIGTRPLAGSGPGSFWVEYPAFRRPEIFDIEGKHNNETDHPENEPLEQWADGGLPGLVLWLWLFGGLLVGGFRVLYWGTSDKAGAYGAGLYSAVFGSVLLMSASMSARFPAPGWLIYFVAGLLGAVIAGSRDGAEQVAALPLPFGKWRYLIAAPVCAAGLLLGYGSVRAFQSDLAHNMAIYYSKTGQWDWAMMTYDREAPWSGTYIMSRYFMGNVCMDSGEGNPVRALEYYRQVRSLAPDYVQVHYKEALALRKLGLNKEAVERLERQVRLDPVWPAAWKELSAAYEALGEREKAAAASSTAEAALKDHAQPAPSAGAMEKLRRSGGIGIRVSFNDGLMVIEDVSRNGPADTAGLKPGDQIFDITPRKPENYKGEYRVFHPRNFTAEQAARELTGEPGTKVTLVIWPIEGRKDAKAPKWAGSGWRGRVRAVQLTRIGVRVLPDELDSKLAMETIAASRRF